MTKRQEFILSFFKSGDQLGIQDIITRVSGQYDAVSKITINRDLKELLHHRYVLAEGKGKATRYRISPTYNLLQAVDVDEYFSKDQDIRASAPMFNFEIFNLLSHHEIFTKAEDKHLMALHQEYLKNKKDLSHVIIRKEFERLTIDLSWKSAQIEGNTYTLLETESLLKDGIWATGKNKQEAYMLLNHKYTLEFIMHNLEQFQTINPTIVTHLHQLLVKDLDISTSLRSTLVGITGTNYKPLDNQFQIREALEDMCRVINKHEDIFTKAALAMLLVGYIQPFEDGNKRTSRLLGDAILLSFNSCPLSFRSVGEVEYKKAMLLFYETNNLSAFKNIFIDQFEFAVKNYFRVNVE